MEALEEELRRWLSSMVAHIQELASQDFGYPIGKNEVLPGAVASRLLLPEGLRPLYYVCNGISLPDVQNGYFIEPADRVLSARGRGDPSRVVGEGGRELKQVVTFGSDGGGNRFAMDLHDGSIWYLPSDCAVHDAVLIETEHVKPKMVAPTLMAFLWRLDSDFDAFLRRVPDHRYLAD